jgi:hypothetical protein
MGSMTQAEGKVLQIQVNMILKMAMDENQKSPGIKGAINWGDLKCVDIIECHSRVENYSYVLICIEEASPDATELISFVKRHLDTAGFEARFGVPVVVEAQW